jgi:hypothetical protein
MRRGPEHGLGRRWTLAPGRTVVFLFFLSGGGEPNPTQNERGSGRTVFYRVPLSTGLISAQSTFLQCIQPCRQLSAHSKFLVSSRAFPVTGGRCRWKNYRVTAKNGNGSRRSTKLPLGQQDGVLHRVRPHFLALVAQGPVKILR